MLVLSDCMAYHAQIQTTKKGRRMTALSAYRFSTITLESQPENCLIRQKTSGSQRNRRAPPELYEELSEFYKMVRNLHDRNSHEVDFVMRFGGEEYRVVVIPDVNNPSYSLRRSLSTPPELEKIGIHPRIIE
jgi:hypothetical protein